VARRLEAETSLRIGELVTLAVDVRRLHFFDLESGAAIGRPAAEDDAVPLDVGQRALHG
jgi:hypothetical protein